MFSFSSHSWGQWRDIVRYGNFTKRRLGARDMENIARTIVSYAEYSLHMYMYTQLSTPVYTLITDECESLYLVIPHISSSSSSSSSSSPSQLVYCLKHFSGDDKVKVYIHRLIDPREITEDPQAAIDQQEQPAFTEEEYIALMNKDPETLFQDDTYLKHLRRHSTRFECTLVRFHSR